MLGRGLRSRGPVPGRTRRRCCGSGLGLRAQQFHIENQQRIRGNVWPRARVRSRVRAARTAPSSHPASSARNASCQPLITPLAGKLAGVPRRVGAVELRAVDQLAAIVDRHFVGRGDRRRLGVPGLMTLYCNPEAVVCTPFSLPFLRQEVLRPQSCCARRRPALRRAQTPAAAAARPAWTSCPPCASFTPRVDRVDLHVVDPDAVQLLAEGEAEQIARLIVAERRSGRRRRGGADLGGRRRRRGGVLRERRRGGERAPGRRSRRRGESSDGVVCFMARTIPIRVCNCQRLFRRDARQRGLCPGGCARSRTAIVSRETQTSCAGLVGDLDAPNLAAAADVHGRAVPITRPCGPSARDWR